MDFKKPNYLITFYRPNNELIMRNSGLFGQTVWYTVVSLVLQYVGGRSATLFSLINLQIFYSVSKAANPDI